MTSNLIIRAITQPQQDRRIHGVRNDHSSDARHTAQPRQIHRPWTEYVLYHLAHETPDVLAGRWVVEEHAVLDQRIVRLRDPAGIILVQMHPEDVHTHLPDDNQTSDN